MVDPLVLIIDESETARDLYGQWFMAHGFQVMCAAGAEGLSLALRRGRPQLIVTELRARDLTLHVLTRCLRSDPTMRCIPILVLTSSSDQTAIADAKSAGAAAVLPKWCAFDLLDSWVSALCNERPSIEPLPR